MLAVPPDDDIGASHSRGSRGSLNQPGDVELVELMMERHAVVVGPDSEGAAADGVAAGVKVGFGLESRLEGCCVCEGCGAALL